MRPAVLLAALAALACAPRAAAPPPPRAAAGDPRLATLPAEIRAAVRERRVVPGMDAAAVRLSWGEPRAVERRPSAAAEGLVYEGWRYGGEAGDPAPPREVWFVDGKVIGVVGPATAR